MNVEMLQPTTRFHFRKLTLEDQDAIFQLRSDDAINKYIDREKATCIEDATKHIQKIEKLISESEAYFWVIVSKETNAFVGTLVLYKINDALTNAEIGFELLPMYHCLGMLQEVLPELIKYADGILRKTLDKMQVSLIEANNEKLYIKSTPTELESKIFAAIGIKPIMTMIKSKDLKF
jgi:[ribosomal protein S5]-alanine N-acetyltransferase